MQKFAEVVRGYIVAYQDDAPAYRDIAPWWTRYQKARETLFNSWRLRGGICTPQHVRECFRWLSLDFGASLLQAISALWDMHWADSPGSNCLLSLLDVASKEQLASNSTWILYWSREPDLEHSILVGEYACHALAFY
jgi:hypothetical protein